MIHNTNVNEKLSTNFHERVHKSELEKSLRISLDSVRDTTLSASVRHSIAKHIKTLREALNKQGHKEYILYNFSPK